MNLTDQLCYAMMDLLLDAAAPLSVVFPEARTFRPKTRAVDVNAAIEWLRAASDKGWLTLSVDDMDGAGWPFRAVVAADLVQIADEYKRGLRDADEVRQILDRFDLWLEITASGREAVGSAWPDMPPEA